MIIDIQPCSTDLSLWRLYYKKEKELNFNIICLTYYHLKLFLECYCYETNDIFALNQFGISIKNIKQNSKLLA